MRAHGFVPFFLHGQFEKAWYESWAITRALPSSVHMYLTDANSAARCLLDSRCVRPEDYRPHRNESLRLPVVPGETGVLPAWRVFGVNFVGYNACAPANTQWGSRPDKWHGTVQSPCRDWGACGETEWSYHVLGNKWIITCVNLRDYPNVSPFPYPSGHTYIPMSMEQACRATPMVPHSQRKDVLVLGKLTRYFHHITFTPTIKHLDRVAEAIKPNKLIATIKKSDGDPLVIPNALTQLGPQDPASYRDLLSSAKVLLGVGKPEISPTPYEAL